jgi:uncharacterized protein (DUF983 family)
MRQPLADQRGHTRTIRPLKNPARIVDTRAGPPLGREFTEDRPSMRRPPAPLETLGRIVRLRCPACGVGPLFRGPFAMAAGCRGCGLSFEREPGFYLGSIYINYGVTVICTGLLYAALVLGLRTSHQTALAATLVMAVVLPVAFFRHARAWLFAMDHSVNRHQSATDDADEPAAEAGLSERHLARLLVDDGRAGCMMGVVLALILLFGLLMGGVTLFFAMQQPHDDTDGFPAGTGPAPRHPRASSPTSRHQEGPTP